MNRVQIARLQRRRFTTSVGAVGVASVLSVSRTASALPPPETTKLRLIHGPLVCFAPLYLSEALLRLEGYEPRYDMSVEILRGLPYDQWRRLDPADTLRFHALRLHEVGMIKATREKIIGKGTDWRFLNELKKELKA
jgi:hypothetical protein